MLFWIALFLPASAAHAQKNEPTLTVNFDAAFALPPRLPGPTIRPVLNTSLQRTAAAMVAKLAKSPTYEGWRRLSAFYEANFQYAEAAAALRAEARMYRHKNYIDAALIEENKASNLETGMGLYFRRPATSKEFDSLYTGAPNEPFLGCYRGAFIDRDQQVGGKHFDENWQEHHSIADFETLTGHKHASYFMYLTYGRPFPRQWVAECKRANAIPHIAWEPKSLAAVRDDSYLKSWAKALREADWPIFVRFAGEMNGFWTPYHGNPRLYREKFALVHRVLHYYSPRVATIWCVGAVPLGNIGVYYPGDANCDWVGINLYSVPFADNDPKRPTVRNSPLTFIAPIYNQYAARKPIAICEYGASHRAVTDRILRNDFAIDKMTQLYTALPILFPRIKLIDWFSMDTIRYTAPGRPQNNYELTEQKSILAAYHKIHNDDYFLGAPQHLGDRQPLLQRPLYSGQIVRGSLPLTIWIKTYVTRPKVYLRWNNKIIYAARRPGAHAINLDFAGVTPGKQILTAYAFDDANRFIASRSATINIVR